MRPDQIERLRDLSEKLADVFITEADPVEWPGDGKSPADLTQQERGDRFWSKKNAIGTGAVLKHTLDLIKHHENPGRAKDDDDGADLDRTINEAERRAKAALDRVLNKAKGKAEFDRRVHGKG